MRRRRLLHRQHGGHAAEQDRPDILKRRWEWFESQPDLDPERLVFIDETWASTNMARTHGWAPRGERLRAAVPHGHWKTTTFVAGLRTSGMVAPMVLDGPINGELFKAYVEQVLMPELQRDGRASASTGGSAPTLDQRVVSVWPIHEATRGDADPHIEPAAPEGPLVVQGSRGGWCRCSAT